MLWIIANPFVYFLIILYGIGGNFYKWGNVFLESIVCVTISVAEGDKCMFLVYNAGFDLQVFMYNISGRFIILC